MDYLNVYDKDVRRGQFRSNQTLIKQTTNRVKAYIQDASVAQFSLISLLDKGDKEMSLESKCCSIQVPLVNFQDQLKVKIDIVCKDHF